nr:hypothetical protein [Tanacetum cinerariifolium]
KRGCLFGAAGSSRQQGGFVHGSSRGGGYGLLFTAWGMFVWLPNSSLGGDCLAAEQQLKGCLVPRRLCSSVDPPQTNPDGSVVGGSPLCLAAEQQRRGVRLVLPRQQQRRSVCLGCRGEQPALGVFV